MRKRVALWFLNSFLCGTRLYKFKRLVLRMGGIKVAEGARVVGPLFCTTELEIGRDSFVGAFFKATGNGHVFIGERCDIAPEVTMSTGSHQIGPEERRAGVGITDDVRVGDGSWIGQRALLLAGVSIPPSTVIAAGAVVLKPLPVSGLYAGVPAILKKDVSDLRSEDREGGVSLRKGNQAL